MDRHAVDEWLAAYVAAWKSYDRDAIGALFSDDAQCWYHPFDDPVVGRKAIVDSWAEEDRRDALGTYDGEYHCLVVEGDQAVARGRSRYFKPDGSVDKEYGNIFVLKFDADGRCREFREWYMSPRGQA
jgi:ketosteroid isomerase-like protein